MTTRPYELLARFGENGHVVGVQIRRITNVDGKDFEGDPIPLSQAANDPAFASFADQFSSSAVAERDMLRLRVTELENQIRHLKESLPFNPRVMEAKAFVGRISATEMLTLASATDPQVQQIVQMLTDWMKNDWPIVLDSPEIQGAIPYLMSLGLITPDRVSELLRDCTRDEAFLADGV